MRAMPLVFLTDSPDDVPPPRAELEAEYPPPSDMNCQTEDTDEQKNEIEENVGRPDSRELGL